MHEGESARLLQVWLCAIPGVEPQAKNEQMERSSYYVFDTASWEAVRKDNFVSSLKTPCTLTPSNPWNRNPTRLLSGVCPELSEFFAL